MGGLRVVTRDVDVWWLAGSAAIHALSGITNSTFVPLTIGARANTAASGLNNQFLGDVDEVAIYNYALSSN